jgi:hypothetical protein
MFYYVNKIGFGRSRNRRHRTNAPPSDLFRRSGSLAGTTPPISPNRGGSGLHAKPLDATIGEYSGCIAPDGRQVRMSLKNEEKVPYLSAVSLALSVRRYVTKRIDRRSGSRAIPEATCRRLRASMAADICNRSVFFRDFLSFFIVNPLFSRSR